MKLNEYIRYILEKGINLQPGQPVEIVCSWYLKNFIESLKNACLKLGASSIYIHYSDGPDFEQRLQEGYDLYLEEDIRKYNFLIANHFCRIHIQSPFLFPLAVDKAAEHIYRRSLAKLEFVSEYFQKNLGQRTMCLAANPYWAAKLKISEAELWNIIFDFTQRESLLETIRDRLTTLKVESLYFTSERGTNLTVELTKDFAFQGKHQRTASGIVFQPNIPCLEIYTAPDKYGVNGTLVSEKPLYLRGRSIPYYRLVFENGKAVVLEGLEDILADEGLLYTGEIAMVANWSERSYYAALLDENCSCHLALGNAYPYGIYEKDRINHCPYHIDLPVGGRSLKVVGRRETYEYTLIKQGKWVYEE